MAHGSAVRIIYDQGYIGGRVMALITNIGATDLSRANTTTPGTGTIDASELDNHVSSPVLSIEKISWNTSGPSGDKYFNVVFDAADNNDDKIAFPLSGSGHWGKSHTAALDAPITNNASSPTGDISIETVNFDDAADIISVVIILKKVSGFTTRPDYSG